MKELLIVSGKGGTGKTSITASLASLFKDIVLADCDVDASDLHLIFEPDILKTTSFISGHEASVRQEDCTGCSKCIDVCKFNAIAKNDDGKAYIDPVSCEGCGVCSWNCPADAIDFKDAECGQWYLSETRYGPMIHAKLKAAAENSGKLVSEVRFNAKLKAQEVGIEKIIIDGPPGIGCPVIAAMTGVDYVLIVAEPTLSGMHDMERVVSLARHFGVNVLACINKYDINEQVAGRIEEKLRKNDIPFIGKIPYDKTFTQSMIQKKSVTEAGQSKAAEAINDMYIKLKAIIDKGDN